MSTKSIMPHGASHLNKHKSDHGARAMNPFCQRVFSSLNKIKDLTLILMIQLPVIHEVPCFTHDVSE